MLVFSARDFGARGDGDTDDTAAIQAALDAASAVGGAVVHLEAGTYVVSGSGKASAGCLQIGSNVVLAGDGMGETVIRLADGSSGDITGIVRTPSSQVTADVTIRDLTIDGNSAKTTGDVDGIFTGVAAGVDSSCHDILIANVEVKNVSRYGFDPHEQTERLVIVGSTAHDNGKDGFTLDYVVDTVVAGNTAQDNGRHGFNLVTSSHDVLIANSFASGNASVGLVVQNGSEVRAWVDDVLIVGGRFHDNGLQGVLIKLASDVTLAGAEVYGNAEDGVLVHGATDAAILDSEIHDNSAGSPGTFDGIRLLDYTSGSYAVATNTAWPVLGTTIRGNAIYNTGPPLMEDGISLVADGSRTIRIAGNTFDNLAGADLNVGNAIVRPAPVAAAASGTDGIDRMIGDAGDERFAGGGGNDYIDGGGGTDEASYAGPLDHYDIMFLGDGSLIVRDRYQPSGGDGIDVVMDVERLVFDGVAFAVGDLRTRDKSFSLAFFDFRGEADDDVFVGSVAADILDGGKGRDTLVGGAGDDRYVVDNVLDRVVERVDGGIDTIAATVDFTLADNSENLELAGAAFSGRGNGLDNRITGTGDANELKGYDGNDILLGKGGDDRLYAYDDADTLQGGAGNDELNAGAGADDLDGGPGGDIMRGGPGDDRYMVDDSADRVVEYNDGGNDTIEAGLDYALPQKVENLVLTGVAREGLGNALDNHILGTSGDDLIDGGAGADRMEGGRGNDTYVVDLASDAVIEFGATRQGVDTVRARSSFVLPDNVENLSLLGDADINGTGNGTDNRIDGSDGANRLAGLGGNDILTGHGGRDSFGAAGGGRDVVTDFDPGQDKLDLRDTAIGSRQELIDASTAKAGGVVIDLGGGSSITLAKTVLNDLESIGLILA